MKSSLQHISVIGAGAWGTALAQVFAKEGRSVTLYARSAALTRSINLNHINDTYLPGVKLHENIRAVETLKEAGDADIILMTTPTQYVRETLTRLKPDLRKGAPLVNCAKGIEITSGKLISEIIAEIAPENPYAVLSGPTFANEVVRGLPTAVTFAAAAAENEARTWAQALSGKTFRPYLSKDPIGAEIAGAIKNVIAIACGIVEGKALGQNAKAAVMTRGMAEIKRLGLAKGADAATFLGLSGIGDLTLTCHSMMSRNYSLGFELGQGRTLKDILAKRHTVAEGVATAKAVAQAAEAAKVEMPISMAVAHILHQNSSIDEMITALLSRNLKSEEA